MNKYLGDEGPDEKNVEMGKADKLLTAKEAKLLLSVVFSSSLDGKKILN